MSNRSRCGPARIRLSLGKPSAEIVRIEALSLCDFLAHEMAFGSVSWFACLLSQSCGRWFGSPLVRGSFGSRTCSENLLLVTWPGLARHTCAWRLRIATCTEHLRTKSKLRGRLGPRSCAEQPLQRARNTEAYQSQKEQILQISALAHTLSRAQVHTATCRLYLLGLAVARVETCGS